MSPPRTLIKSVSFDMSTLLSTSIALTDRVRFLLQKALALLNLAAGREFRIRLHDQAFHGSTISDLGTLHSSILDVADMTVATGIASDIHTVIDVGANCGQWASALRWLAPHVQIWSIEPSPRVYVQLLRNCGALAGMTCLNFAIGDRDGNAVLYERQLSVMSSLKHETIPANEPVTTTEIEVRTLDSLLPMEVDLIKVDVEGGEYEVLRGAGELLARAKYLLIELSLNRSATEALALLSHIRTEVPTASIVKFGRPLGDPARPACQDVLIALRPNVA